MSKKETVQPPSDVSNVFRVLAEVVYAGDSYESVYESLCAFTVEYVDGCDHASLMLRRHGRVSTAGASDEIAVRVDGLERELGTGPCVDAMDGDQPDGHYAPDLTAGTSMWPELSTRILAETPVRGMAGFRIRHQQNKVGALNIFSDTPDGLTAASLDQASLISAFASVTLVALERGEEASTLRRGLESNREIGKAIGLLMALHNVDDEAAFEMLARLSQDLNIKLAEVARRVLERHKSGDLST